jgi:hypothetical protein
VVSVRDRPCRRTESPRRPTGRGYLGNVIWELFGKWRARPVTPWNPRTAQLLHSTATATRARSPRQPRSWRQHATNPDFRRAFGGSEPLARSKLDFWVIFRFWGILEGNLGGNLKTPVSASFMYYEIMCLACALPIFIATEEKLHFYECGRRRQSR